MADLKINFAGINSPNPFWLASGPPTNSGYQIMKAFDAGWGGAVWKTMGLPVVNSSSRYAGIDFGDKKMVGFSNIELISDRPLSHNLKELEEVKKYFPDNPVIASLMVDTREEWHRVVKDAENAGADGLELNFGCPHGMCERGMGSAVGQEPDVLKLIVSWVMEVATKPVIVKLTPNVTDITDSAIAAKEGGGNAISLINTFQSIMGVDIDNFTPYPAVDGKGTNGGYCGPAVKPIALNMVRNCAQSPYVGLPVSGIGGVSNWRDAVEFMLMGAATVQVCTAVMHYGFGIIREMTSGLSDYMDSKGFSRVHELVGKALKNTVAWEDLNLNYNVIAEIDNKKCIGCMLCYAACEDGAHQAIGIGSNGSRVPHVIEDNCVGCNLCSLVCPVEGCITMVESKSKAGFESWKDRTASGNIPKTFDDPLAGGLSHRVTEIEKALRKMR